MNIVVNLDRILSIFDLPSDILTAKIFLYIGWLPMVVFLLWAIWQLWLYYIQMKYAAKREFILLAVDIPQGNEQSPLAIEQMFSHLAGAHGSINLAEQYWEGKTQDRFSFEIVSIDGYTQYLIYTMKQYRDLVEAMLYAQYPEAEIYEVDDYVQNYPDKFPDDKYDIHGGEWILQKPSAYPIRTYLDFEHQFSGEFKDPFAALIELFSSLRKGEQCWYQIIITPKGFEWEQLGYKEISKIIGEKIKANENIFDKSINVIINLLTTFSEFIIPLWGEIKEKEEEEKEISMLNLRPVQKKQIEAIQQKISKIGFDIKIRFIYIAEKEVFDKTRFGSFVGVMKQFNVNDLNGLKPDMDFTVTTAKYVWKASRLNGRKNRLVAAYKARDNWAGRLPGILNIEEMATLWHFPIEESVSAPMLQKVSSRKSSAPGYLPVQSGGGAESVSLSEELIGEDKEKEDIFSNKPAVKEPAGAPETPKQSGPPANLPIE